MQIKQLLGPKVKITAIAPAKPANTAAKRRREYEELKIQVMELAGGQMDNTVQVLRKWLLEPQK